MDTQEQQRILGVFISLLFLFIINFFFYFLSIILFSPFVCFVMIFQLVTSRLYLTNIPGAVQHTPKLVYINSLKGPPFFLFFFSFEISTFHLLCWYSFLERFFYIYTHAFALFPNPLLFLLDTLESHRRWSPSVFFSIICATRFALIRAAPCVCVCLLCLAGGFILISHVISHLSLSLTMWPSAFSDRWLS